MTEIEAYVRRDELLVRANQVIDRLEKARRPALCAALEHDAYDLIEQAEASDDQLTAAYRRAADKPVRDMHQAGLNQGLFGIGCQA